MVNPRLATKEITKIVGKKTNEIKMLHYKIFT